VEERRFGFEVESVHQVITLNAKDFQPTGAMSALSGTEIISHFCQTEDKTISILRLQEAVAA
jgi:chemotaxis signal transduction protein